MGVLLGPPLLVVPEPFRLFLVLGAHMPWHLASASPALDCMAPVAPLAPRFVVKFVGAERRSCAINSELALWAEEMDALW